MRHSRSLGRFSPSAKGASPEGMQEKTVLLSCKVTGMEKEGGMCLPGSLPSLISQKSSFTPWGACTWQFASSSPSGSQVFALQCGVSTMPRNEGQLSTDRFNNNPPMGTSHPALQKQQQCMVWDAGSAFRKKGS